MAARGPAFVTPHAVRQFIARIAPSMGYDEALTAVLDGLSRPLSVRPTRNGAAVVVRAGGRYRFRAVVRGSSSGKGVLPVLVTVLRAG